MLKDLSAAALRAAMKGGTEGWGQWASALEHVKYAEPIKEPGGRRKCHCGCGKRSTHRGMANGICLSMGCELSMHRWAKA